MHVFTMLHLGGTARPRATQFFIQAYICVIQTTHMLFRLHMVPGLSGTHGLHMCYPYGYPMVIQLHMVSRLYIGYMHMCYPGYTFIVTTGYRLDMVILAINCYSCLQQAIQGTHGYKLYLKLQ